MLEKGLGNVPNSIVGASGNAFVWDASWEEDEDEELEEEQSENALLWRLGYEPADLVMTSADFDDTFSDYCTTESSFGEYEHYDELHRHYMEVEDTINRSIEENHTVENALLELNALKMACNITFHDLRKSTIPAILKHIDHSRLEESMRKLMSKWLSLIKRFTSCQEDQIDCLWITVDYCCRLESSVGPNLFFLLLKLYYEKDLVDEDPILEWFSQEDNWQSTASDDEDYQQHRITPSFAENRRKIRKNAAEFVKWLEEAETESD
jgi:translation initiation factor eIF-2B subunit epsilon